MRPPEACPLARWKQPKFLAHSQAHEGGKEQCKNQCNHLDTPEVLLRVAVSAEHDKILKTAISSATQWNDMVDMENYFRGSA